MLALAISGSLLAAFAIGCACNPNLPQEIKETILGLAKAGYGAEKIMQIVDFYLYW